MEKIGMIGTGAMGLALLERLEVGGVNAVCYDAYAPALEQARALGMRVVGSAAEVAAESTLIDIVVRTDEDVVDCVIGARGVLANAQPPGTLERRSGSAHSSPFSALPRPASQTQPWAPRSLVAYPAAASMSARYRASTTSQRYCEAT